MSLFIKCNIGLPHSCKSCPFNYTDVCIASNKGIDTRAFVHLRHPDCPMVELPTPHGRLIDADKLQTSIHGCLCETCETFSCEKGRGCLIEDVFNLLDQTPTVIGAEVSE